MFSEKLKIYAEAQFEKRLPKLGECAAKVQKTLENVSFEEGLLLKFLYGTMPIRDAGEYEPEVFLGFVRHGLMVRDTMEWCRQVPEDIFLHHILYYRINSENIENCRDFFYEQLKDRVKGMTMEQAILEVNYWCAEQACYGASDDRTISPMTVYRSGNGRCGEESTFTVTALRSVGIPARQVYTPRWAHCDDNHAWAEAWADGQWHFLGACEPEEVLDKGWFTNAASRALLVHSRTFSDYTLEPADNYIGREEHVFYYNETVRYARTKKCRFQVVDENGQPVSGAQVSIEVLNMAEYHSITTLLTDENGWAEMILGLGDVHLHAQKDGIYGECWFSAAEEDQAIVTLKRQTETKDWVFTQVRAPEDGPVRRILLTKEQKERNRERLSHADTLRRQRQDSYYEETRAEAYPEEAEFLRYGGENFQEIMEFLSRDENPDRRNLLHTLSRKDAKDARAAVLEDHLKYCPRTPESQKLPEEVFVSCVLAPRIFTEELTAWRGELSRYLTSNLPERAAQFSERPREIWEWICREIRYDEAEDYSEICETPMACLRLGQGNPMSRKLLFVAVCRTLGIPARLHPATLEAEYWENGVFVPVNTAIASAATASASGASAAPALVRLSVADGEKWNYDQTWTVGKLCGGQFVTLHYAGLTFVNDQCSLQLEPGTYRFLTTSRMPSGNQHAMEFVCTLNAGEERELFLPLREGKIEDMLISVKLDDFALTTRAAETAAETVAETAAEPGNGAAAESMASRLLGDQTGIVAFLEEGKEPTEHVLNEMLEAREELESLGVPLFVVVRQPESLENRTLQKVLEAIPGIQVCFADFDSQVEPLARRVYVDPDKLPLLLVIRASETAMTAIYGCSGYHVGSVRLMAACIRQESGRTEASDRSA